MQHNISSAIFYLIFSVSVIRSLISDIEKVQMPYGVENIVNGQLFQLKYFIYLLHYVYNSIQEHSAVYCGDELNADMSSSFGGIPRSLERGGCH